MSKPKWPKKYCKIVKIHLYGSSIYAFNSRKGFEKAAAYMNVDVSHYGTDGISLPLEDKKDGSSIYILGIFDGKLDTLVHECAHITHFVAQKTGWDSSAGNGEPYCYLIGHIFKKLERFVKND